MSSLPRTLGRAEPSTDDLLATVETLMGSLARGGGGPCGEMACEHLGSGGKRLRARLALEATSALGGAPAAAVPWAAACELLHNASLVHDDLQDGDRTRRGRPALWAVHGPEQAISVGDLLLMLPTLALEHLSVPDGVKWRLARLVAHHGARTARGQAAELALKHDAVVGMEAYLAAAEGKTAGLFGLPVEGAAVIAGRADDAARRLARPFERLGLLFQLQDDVIDLYGQKGRGAPGADIREGKVSALVVAHLRLHPEDRLWLAGILRRDRDETSAVLVEEVTRRFREGGALAHVFELVEQLADAVDGPVLRHEPGLRQAAIALRDRILAPLAGITP